MLQEEFFPTLSRSWSYLRLNVLDWARAYLMLNEIEARANGGRELLLWHLSVKCIDFQPDSKTVSILLSNVIRGEHRNISVIVHFDEYKKSKTSQKDHLVANFIDRSIVFFYTAFRKIYWMYTVR
jgi:hypothetical protein